MKFMLIVKANEESEAGVMPSMEMLESMGKFNEEMAQAGILRAGEGLTASSQGARVKFSPGKPVTVIDGPFTETKELIAGFWIIEVNSREEAIEWAKRSPAPHGPDKETAIEVRRFFDPSDFGPEVEKSENELRARIEKQQK